MIGTKSINSKCPVQKNDNETPSYLEDPLPSLVNDVSNSYLRKNTNYDSLFVGYVRTRRLFFPFTLKLWNDLNAKNS